MDTLLHLLVAGLTTAGVYCLIGYSFDLCWRVAKVFNIAQPSCGIFGVFVYLWLRRYQVPLWMGVIVAILLAGMLGLLAERIAITPLRHSKVISFR